MKKSIIAYSLFLAALLAACAPAASGSASTFLQGSTAATPAPAAPSSVSGPASSAPPAYNSEDLEEQETLDFLSEEQLEVFQQAQETVMYTLGDASTLTLFNGNSSGETLYVPSGQYTLVHGPDENYDDFYARMCSIFTTDCLHDMNFHLKFVSLQGQLAACGNGIGGNIHWSEYPDTYKLVEQTDDTVVFLIVGHFIDQRPDETADEFIQRRAQLEFDWTEEFLIGLVNTEDGWRVDEFSDPAFSEPVNINGRPETS